MRWGVRLNNGIAVVVIGILFECNDFFAENVLEVKRKHLEIWIISKLIGYAREYLLFF
jgi:hypothetical protein